MKYAIFWQIVMPTALAALLNLTGLWRMKGLFQLSLQWFIAFCAVMSVVCVVNLIKDIKQIRQLEAQLDLLRKDKK